MKLTKIAYLNLNFHKERDARMRRWLRDIGVPDTDILRFEGIDGAQYKNRDAVIAAAAADGFSEFQDPNLPDWFPKGDVAMNWAFRRIIREVRKLPADEAWFILLDECQLTHDFRVYQEIIANAPRFDFFQFMHWDPVACNDDVAFGERMHRAPKLKPCTFDNQFLIGSHTRLPGDQANVYAAAGASKILSLVSQPGNAHIAIETLPTTEIVIADSTWQIISPAADNLTYWAKVHQEESHREAVNRIDLATKAAPTPIDLKRPYLVKMPPLTKSIKQDFRYATHGDVAVIIPLFCTQKQLGTEITEAIYDALCKRAMWLAYELVHFTDMVQQGVACYIVVTEEMRPFFQTDASACDFPDDRVIWIEETSEKWIGNAAKFPAMCAVAERGFEKVISMDTHIFFYQTEWQTAYPVFGCIRKQWRDEKLFCIDPWNRDYNPVAYDVCAIGYGKLSRAAYEARVAAYTGVEIAAWDAEADEMPTIRGGIFGIAGDLLRRTKFRSEMQTIAQFANDDEASLSIYWQKHLTASDIYPATTCFNWADLEEVVAGTDWERPMTRMFHNGYLNAETQAWWLKHHQNLLPAVPTSEQTETAIRLTPEDMQFFRDKGYVIKRGVLDPARMQQAIDFHWQSAPERLKHGQPETYTPFTAEEECQEEADGEVMLARGGTSWRNRHIRHCEWVLDVLPRNPSVWAMASQLLGEGNIVEPYHNRTFGRKPGADIRGIYCILPGDGGGSVHVDGHPFHLGVVAYLDDVPPGGGGFTLFPGSHQIFYPLYDKETGGPHPPDLDERYKHLADSVEFHGQAGDILFWHNRMAHCIRANTSAQIRIALFCDFMRKDYPDHNDAPHQDMWHNWAFTE